jgi:hypothetical protein
MRDTRNAQNIVVREVEGKRLPVRPRRKWEDTIKMDLRHMVGNGVD